MSTRRERTPLGSVSCPYSTESFRLGAADPPATSAASTLDRIQRSESAVVRACTRARRVAFVSFTDLLGCERWAALAISALLTSPKWDRDLHPSNLLNARLPCNRLPACRCRKHAPLARSNLFFISGGELKRGRCSTCDGARRAVDRGDQARRGPRGRRRSSDRPGLSASKSDPEMPRGRFLRRAMPICLTEEITPLLPRNSARIFG